MVTGNITADTLSDCGVKLMPSSVYYPPARTSPKMKAYNSQNSVIMMGGLIDSVFAYLNDIWRYDISDNTWTWLSGECNHTTPTSKSPVINPGGNKDHGIAVVDDIDLMYLYGGAGANSNLDVWVFSLTNLTWSIVQNPCSWSCKTPVAGYFGDTNFPNLRYGNSLTYVPMYRVLVMFGGFLPVSTYHSFQNDLWVFNITSNQWAFLRGNATNVQMTQYGQTQVTSSDSFPPARRSHSATLVGENVYIMGGFLQPLPDYSYLFKNDFWQFSLTGFTSDTSALVTTTTTTKPSSSLDAVVSKSSLKSSQIPQTHHSPILVPVALSLNNLFENYQGLLLIVGCAVVSIGIIACSVMMYCFVKKRHAKLIPEFASSLALTQMDDTAYAQITTTTTALRGMTDVATVIQTDVVEIAFPGFLEITQDKDFVIKDSIAKGGFGTIFRGDLLNPELASLHDGSDCVVKQVNFQNPEESILYQEEVRGFQQEVAIMYFFRKHDNFAKIFGFCTSPISIIMKHYVYGTLIDLVFTPDKKSQLKNIVYDSQMIVSLATDIANALDAMHTAGFSHNDIKPANILLDVGSRSALKAVLTDFGVSQIVTNDSLLVSAFQKSKITGASVAYAAPELLQTMMNIKPVEKFNLNATVMSEYGHSKREERLLRADCYSFAIVLFEMMTRTAAWPRNSTADKIIQNVLSGGRPLWTEHTIKWCRSEKLAQVLKDLVEQCWSQESLMRPRMSSVVEILNSIEYEL